MTITVLMRKSVLTNILISLLTIVLVVGAFASFQRKRSSFERIDFTFARHNGVIVVKNVDTGSGAARAGLLPGDQILVIGPTPSSGSGSRSRWSSRAAARRSPSPIEHPS